MLTFPPAEPHELPVTELHLRGVGMASMATGLTAEGREELRRTEAREEELREELRRREIREHFGRVRELSEAFVAFDRILAVLGHRRDLTLGEADALLSSEWESRWNAYQNFSARVARAGAPAATPA